MGVHGPTVVVSVGRVAMVSGRIRMVSDRLPRLTGAQPNAVAGVQHLHPRVGRPDARQPGVLQGHPDPHIEVRVRQGRHLARASARRCAGSDRA